jgi:hypothetical protein
MNLENVEGSLVRNTVLMACSESSILFLLVILLMIIHKGMETDGKLALQGHSTCTRGISPLADRRQES